jgi:hypothetical protein
MTDGHKSYEGIGKEFAGHEAVNHQANEYVRGEAHTNTVEGYFPSSKRGIIGTYHHISKKHLPRYLGEFDMRYNARRIKDGERAVLAGAGRWRETADLQTTHWAMRAMNGKLAPGKKMIYHFPEVSTKMDRSNRSRLDRFPRQRGGGR